MLSKLRRTMWIQSIFVLVHHAISIPNRLRSSLIVGKLCISSVIVFLDEITVIKLFVIGVYLPLVGSSAYFIHDVTSKFKVETSVVPRYLIL